MTVVLPEEFRSGAGRRRRSCRNHPRRGPARHEPRTVRSQAPPEWSVRTRRHPRSALRVPRARDPHDSRYRFRRPGTPRWEAVVDPLPMPHPQAARPWWAGTRVDAVLAGAMAVVSVGLALAVPAEPPYEPPDAVTLAAAAAGPLALVWRQTAPSWRRPGPAWPSSRRRPPVHRSTSSPGRPGSPCSAASPPGCRLRAAAAAIAALAVAGYVALDRGDPLAALPSIVLSFLVATIAGALSRRLTHAVAAEANSAAESRRQALEAERLLMQERGRLARAARLAGPHGQRDGPAGRRRTPGVRRQPDLRAGGPGVHRDGGPGRARRAQPPAPRAAARAAGGGLRPDGRRPGGDGRADPGDRAARGAADQRRRASPAPPGRSTGSSRRP